MSSEIDGFNRAVGIKLNDSYTTQSSNIKPVSIQVKYDLRSQNDNITINNPVKS